MSDSSPGRSAHLSAIRRKAKYQKIYRQKYPASKERLALDRNERRSGYFQAFDDSAREDQPWHKEYSRMDWTNADESVVDLRPMHTLVWKIEAEFDVTLTLGVIDDCPW